MMHTLIRRMAGLTLALLLLLAASQTASAQNGNGITEPAGGSQLAGAVSVQGQALHPTFRKWQLDLLPADDPKHSYFLAVGEEPVAEAAELTVFDSGRYPNGSYQLRLRVVYFGLNYDEYFTPIVIANAAGGASNVIAPDEAAGESLPAEPAPVVFAPGPEGAERWIEIDISDQSLTAWQGDVAVFRTTVSTGKPNYETLPGTFHVYRMYEETRMRGEDYDTPDVPWTMYYYGGFAIHGAYWHNNFGTPVSHGCTNMKVPEAKALFAWSEVGTRVVVNE